MSLLLGHDETVAAWVGSQLGEVFFPPWRAIGIMTAEGFLCGGVVVHDFNGSNVELTVILSRPMSRAEIRGVRSYVVDQLQARRVTFRTLASNQAARRLLERRADFEADLPAWFTAGDAVQYRIMSDDPRWSRWRSPE